MATESDAVAYLEKLLKQGCELHERLHWSSVERRKPDTPMSRCVVQPDPGTATPEQMQIRAEEEDECAQALAVWQEERDATCAELFQLTTRIHDLLVGSLARWVNDLPPLAQGGVFDADRLIMAYSGRESRWQEEVEAWERGDWAGLVRMGCIDSVEYHKLRRLFPAGNPKFPESSAGLRHPVARQDCPMVGEPRVV